MDPEQLPLTAALILAIGSAVIVALIGAKTRAPFHGIVAGAITAFIIGFTLCLVVLA